MVTQDSNFLANDELTLFGRAMMEHWREYSPPTDVARVRFSDLPRVG